MRRSGLIFALPDCAQFLTSSVALPVHIYHGSRRAKSLQPTSCSTGTWRANSLSVYWVSPAKLFTRDPDVCLYFYYWYSKMEPVQTRTQETSADARGILHIFFYIVGAHQQIRDVPYILIGYDNGYGILVLLSSNLLVLRRSELVACVHRECYWGDTVRRM